MPPIHKAVGATGAPAAIVAVMLSAGLSGCSSPADGRTVVAVSAAASLATAFEGLSVEFERRHPDVDIALDVGGSTQLAAQIVEGAPADVFAAASPETMAIVVDAGLARAAPVTFASNALTIAVAPGNPRGVSGLADLSRHDLTIIACAPAVPCGAVANAAASAVGVQLDLASEELSVTDVLAKVASGEADAGLVYRTDVAAAERQVDGVAVPESTETVTDYPIVALTNRPDSAVSDAAADWIEFVTGPTGRHLLERLGFGAP